MRTGSNKTSESEPAAAAAVAAAVDSQRGNTAAAVTPSPSQAARTRNRDFASSSFSGTRLDFSDDGARPVAKRQKTAEDDTDTSKDAHLVTDLPTDILVRCIQILGPGHHRFVAGSCRALRLAHREAFEGKDSVAIETTFEDINNQKYRSMELKQVKKKISPTFATFGSTITSSETTALFKIWENETTGEYKGQEINIIREAIALGTQPQNARVTKTLSRTGALGCSAARHGNLSLLSHLLASYPVFRTPTFWRYGSNASMELKKVGEVSTMQSPIVGCDISKNGQEILIKEYGRIYYYCRDEGKSLADVLAGSRGEKQPYRKEPQGEAVCFANDRNGGYYTLSESKGRSRTPLYYYERK